MRTAGVTPRHRIARGETAMPASQPTTATILRHRIEEAREIRAAEMLRRLRPSTRTHRPQCVALWTLPSWTVAPRAAG